MMAILGLAAGVIGIAIAVALVVALAVYAVALVVLWVTKGGRA